jgi:hypothetical protein
MLPQHNTLSTFHDTTAASADFTMENLHVWLAIKWLLDTENAVLTEKKTVDNLRIHLQETALRSRLLSALLACRPNCLLNLDFHRSTLTP